MDKTKKISAYIGIIGVIIGVILTASLSIYDHQIKKFLGVQPKIEWQSEVIEGKNDDDINIYQIKAYNKSDVSGDISVVVEGSFSENNFQIENAKGKVYFESDSRNTFVSIDPIHPNEYIEIILRTNEKLGYQPMQLTSKNFELEKVYPFPSEIYSYRPYFYTTTSILIILFSIILGLCFSNISIFKKNG